MVTPLAPHPLHARVRAFATPLPSQVRTDLRGSTHSDFYSNALAVAQRAPANVSVDGAAAWNGVRLQVEAVHGDPDRLTIKHVGGEVCSPLPFQSFGTPAKPSRRPHPRPTLPRPLLLYCP